jgi:hypothetical protein
MIPPPVIDPPHDKSMAAKFLAILDRSALKFTFQFFGDAASGQAEIFHGSLDDVWPKVQEINTSPRGVGVFVTINETDFKGRRNENIVRPRAFFVDADGPEQVSRCEEVIVATRAVPTMVVRSSPNRAHFYWCCDAVPRVQFSAFQAALIEKMRTDPAIKDLPRVMRLPGTLHLKDPNRPQLVTLDKPDNSPRRWKLDQLITKLELAPKPIGVVQAERPDAVLTRADADRLRRKFGKYLAGDELSAGLETNIEEIKSAVGTIPASAIATELEWTKFARGLAHEGMIYKGQTEQLWDILDAASRLAAGYEQAENRRRWSRYVDEASNREHPITIATVFDMARKYGWPGWSLPPKVTSSSNALLNSGVVPAGSLAAGLQVSFGNIRHRQWLYGLELVRGEITLLASPGGVGKSSLALGMTVALATGRALLDERICGSDLKALYINAEDSGTEMRRRIWAFCSKHQIGEQDLERFFLLGSDDPRTQDLSFLRTEKGNSVLDDAGVIHLEALLAEIRPSVLVLDPLVALCGGGNLNDNSAMSLVMRALKRLANKFDCAILILHHTRKGGDLSNAEAIGGASAIVNLSRRAIMAVPMALDEASRLGVLPSERASYFKTVASKSNLSPRSDDAPWYQLCSITLANPEPPIYMSGDRVQAIARVHLPRISSTSACDDQKIRRAVLDTVDLGKIIDGQAVKYSPNLTGAKNERALIGDAMAAVEAATAPRIWQPGDLRAVVTRTISALRSEGSLIDEPMNTRRFRRTRGLRVEWSRTPWASERDVPSNSDELRVADKTEPADVD